MQKPLSFRRLVATFTALATIVSPFTAFVSVAYAADILPLESFGTGSTDSDVPSWSEVGSGTEAHAAASGNDTASPNGGRFALVDGDGGWICRTFDATGYDTLQLSYYWRGDTSANSSDDGIVEYKTSGSCSDSSGWSGLKNHGLENDGTWTTQAAFSLPVSNNSFLLKFRAASNNTNDDFRVDGVLVTGSVILQPDLVALKTNNTASGAVEPGGLFKWTIRVQNIGEGTATFTNNEDILRDNMPAGADFSDYSGVSVVTSGVTGSVDCDLDDGSQDDQENLTCDANGTVTLPAGSYFDVSFWANLNPSASGTITNPRSSGICRVDPDNEVEETAGGNNNCGDTVAVVQDLCSNIVGIQETIPAGYEDPDEDGICTESDSTAPVVEITSPTDSAVTGSAGNVVYSVGDADSVVCTLDTAEVVCTLTGPYAFVLLDGSHTFTVTGTDSAGNDAMDSVTWTVFTPEVCEFGGEPPFCLPPPPTTGTVVVNKTVVGGVSSVATFQLFVGDTLVGSGTSNEFGEGTYQFTESNGNAEEETYAATYGSGCPGGLITVVAGETTTCDVTNTLVTPGPTPECPIGTIGIYPVCDPIPCPPGTVGVFPACVPVPECPPGTFGVPPICLPIPVCPPGTTGVFPVCTPDVDPTPTPTATIHIVKQTVGGDGVFNFAISGNETTQGGTLDTTEEEDHTADSFFDVFVNTEGPTGYIVSENVPDGWTLTSVECEYPEQEEGTYSSNNANVTLYPGSEVTCTFINTFLGGTPGPTTTPEPNHGGGGGGSTPKATLIVEKVIVGEDASISFSDFRFSVDGEMHQFEEDGSNEIELHAGDYMVTEEPTPGFTVGYSGDCDDNGNLAMLGGETYICVVTNTLGVGGFNPGSDIPAPTPTPTPTPSPGPNGGGGGSDGDSDGSSNVTLDASESPVVTPTESPVVTASPSSEEGLEAAIGNQGGWPWWIPWLILLLLVLWWLWRRRRSGN